MSTAEDRLLLAAAAKTESCVVAVYQRDLADVLALVAALRAANREQLAVITTIRSGLSPAARAN